MANENFMNAVTTAAGYWVATGALSGALLSGANKMVEILKEPSPQYVYPQIERPIRGVYHTSRIAGHAGWGAAVAGFFAATFPVSIPAYMLIRSQYDQKQPVQEEDAQEEVPAVQSVPTPKPSPVLIPAPTPEVNN